MQSNRTTSAAQRSPVNICVLCAVWNAEEWIDRSLDSIAAQRYPHFRCAVVDDASTDATWTIAQRRIATDERFIGWQNERRLMSGVQSQIAAAQALADADSDVLVFVDGDDWLAHPDVLGQIAEIYSDPEIWLTYGSFQRWRNRPLEKLGLRVERGFAARYPDFVADNNLYRYYHFRASHLRTCRKFLWDRIDPAHLKDSDGHYLRAAADVGTMIPMLEMAGPAHSRYIESLLYIYNAKNPRGVRRTRREEQDLAELKIRALPRYAPLRQDEIGPRAGAAEATPARRHRSI